MAAAVPTSSSRYDDESELIEQAIDFKYRPSSNATHYTAVQTAQESFVPGQLFRWLNRREPLQARHRLGNLYWRGWGRVVMSFFLAAFGITFDVIGLLCMLTCDEYERGIGFVIIGMLMTMPGVYGAIILLLYLRGRRGYCYTQLPDISQ